METGPSRIARKVALETLLPFILNLLRVFRSPSFPSFPVHRWTFSFLQLHQASHRHAGRPFQHPNAHSLAIIMFFTKQALVLSSLLLGALVSAVPVPMPIAHAVSHMQQREVKLIRAYEKRQDGDVVTIGDSTPVKAPDGVTVPYTRRQTGDDIISIGDSTPVKAPDGVTVPYTRRQAADDIVNISDSAPVKAPDGVTVPYTRRQTADDIVNISDSTPVKAPDGVTVPYARRQTADDIVTTSDSIPAKAPDGVVVPYTRRQAAGDIVSIGDSTPVKAPEGGDPVPYARKLVRSSVPRMKRTRSSRSHA